LGHLSLRFNLPVVKVNLNLPTVIYSDNMSLTSPLTSMIPGEPPARHVDQDLAPGRVIKAVAKNFKL